MQINVTFRHVDPTPALRSHAEEKLERMVKKHLRRPVDAHVILSVSKERHAAEITLQADHVTMFAKEETTDLYAAIDLAVGKLEHQAQKLREKRKEHKGPSGARHGADGAGADAPTERRPDRASSRGACRPSPWRSTRPSRPSTGRATSSWSSPTTPPSRWPCFIGGKTVTTG